MIRSVLLPNLKQCIRRAPGGKRFDFRKSV